MRLFMVIAILIFAMPMTGFGWAEGTNILLDPNLMCKKTRRLRGKLAEICRHDSALLKEIINGINLGFRECEFQFRNRRWNCTVLRKSMRKILMRDSRETGFVNAITAAGVTYAVTKACTMGQLVECSCDKSHMRRNGGQPQMVNAATAEAALERQQRQQLPLEEQQQYQRRQRVLNNGSSLTDLSPLERLGRNRKPGGKRGRRKFWDNIKFPQGEWEWGGCSDNVNFGLRHSRVFLDAKQRQRRSDLGTLVKLHNNNAGRLAIRDAMRLECKCHGLSGSCTVKTCWLKMPPFREVAARLRERYDSARKVALRNDGNSLMPEMPHTRQANKYQLVFADDSPDFCAPNPKTGALGTQDRECNATSYGYDSCDHLCCSRGHKHRVVAEYTNCKCVFKWCCEVTCEKCLEHREVNTCL
ncbi:proto-oncogene Wnt-3 isoform X1 [Drosophila subobscura]|uniref:proto-oncogene Wnt-3 isoform X1 n=2 Tax=Drosophila subobscura TaxID=7241 RepID=UPI00155AD18C|nr:proto-oncogene Wnt-3 isoform X1 [Drosophila subobscura]